MTKEPIEKIFEEMIDSMEAGELTEEAKKAKEEFSKSNRISWGSENGNIIGVTKEGNRIDINGNPID